MERSFEFGTILYSFDDSFANQLISILIANCCMLIVTF